MKQKVQQIFAYMALVIIFVGCTTISPFSQIAYEQSTSIKATALLLMDKATEPYSKHSKSVENLLLEVHKAYEYAKARPKNGESTRQWEIVLNPKGHSLAGFMIRWKSENILGEGFIIEAKKALSRHFDIISTLESGKEKDK